ncbi:MAG: outer membrane beta-barrel protein [Pseudomonadota bacterium]
MRFTKRQTMRHILLALSTVAAAASAATAQDVPWKGAYGGLTRANNLGDDDYSIDLSYDLEGQTTGAFAGYLWAKNKMVYGVETAVTLGKVYEVEKDGSFRFEDDYQYERFFDLKGRFGYSAGHVLLYSLLGLSHTDFRADMRRAYEIDTSTNGLMYGVGADYRVAGQTFIGVEYLRRSYDFYEPLQDVDISSKINTLTLRVGMEF